MSAPRSGPRPAQGQPSAQSGTHKSISWHSSVHAAGPSSENGRNSTSYPHMHPYDPSQPTYDPRQSQYKESRDTPPSRNPGAYQQPVVKGTLADAIDADSDSCDADAPAYIIFGACRREVAAGTTLKVLWESLPDLEVPEGASRTLCVCTSRSAPSCKYIGSVQPAPSGTPGSRRRGNSSGSLSSQRGDIPGRVSGTLMPSNQAANQAHTQAYHLKKAAETLRELRKLQVKSREAAEGGPFLPLLMSRVERENGRAEVAFRPDHAILPGVTYKAYVRRVRLGEADSGLGQILSGLAFDDKGSGNGSEHSAAVGKENKEDRTGPMNSGPPPPQCLLKFPDGSSMKFPAAITLWEATQQLMRSAQDAPKSTLNASFGTLLPSAAAVAAMLAQHYRTKEHQRPREPSSETKALAAQRSAASSSALSATSSLAELASLKLRASQSSSGTPHPLLLLCRAQEGCRVLIRPHDRLEAGDEYTVRVRTQLLGAVQPSASTDDRAHAHGEMIKSAGERWATPAQPNQGRPQPQAEAQASLTGGVGTKRGTGLESRGRRGIRGSAAAAGSPSPQVPQGHYRSMWGSSTRILTKSPDHHQQQQNKGSFARFQEAPGSEEDLPLRPTTAPAGGRRGAQGGFPTRPGAGTGNDAYSQQGGTGVLDSTSSHVSSGVGLSTHAKDAAELHASAKQEERATGSTMFDGALKRFSTWWQK